MNLKNPGSLRAIWKNARCQIENARRDIKNQRFKIENRHETYLQDAISKIQNLT